MLSWVGCCVGEGGTPHTERVTPALPSPVPGARTHSGVTEASIYIAIMIGLGSRVPGALTLPRGSESKLLAYEEVEGGQMKGVALYSFIRTEAHVVGV